MTTPRAVATEVKQVLDALSDLSLISYANSVSESQSSVSWSTREADRTAFLLSRDDLTVSGYLHWLENSQFSALFHDGSLLQISYSFSGHEIVGHRLAYVPCPVFLDEECVEMIDEGVPLADVVRAQLVNEQNILMKTSVRFDFDPYAASSEHAASHFTINSVDCRIPCYSPMRVGRFVEFVFQHFYAGAYSRHGYLRDMALAGWFKPSINPEHRAPIHLNWIHA